MQYAADVNLVHLITVGLPSRSTAILKVIKSSLNLKLVFLNTQVSAIFYLNPEPFWAYSRCEGKDLPGNFREKNFIELIDNQILEVLKDWPV